MAKKKHHEEHENHERWLVSYADFITLLFAFFVVMYSVSRVDNKKLQQTATSLRWAMHFEGTGGSGAPPIFEGPVMGGGCPADVGAGKKSPSVLINSTAVAAAERIRKELDKKLKPFLLDKSSTAVTVTAEGRNLSIRLAAGRFFDPAYAALRPEALPLLDAVAQEVAALHHPVRVEGHTDSDLVQTARFHNNWELSSLRASTVVAYLEQAHHFKPEMLAAAGLGSSRPLGPNTTADGREANRRIELVVELGVGDVLDVVTR
jgi:chemotaxis protein MotB